MRKSKPIQVVVHYSQEAGGQQELARRVAEAHADAVTARIKRLPCSAAQKQQLLDALIADARKRANTSSRRTRASPGQGR